jgi:hypothetical protein
MKLNFTLEVHFISEYTHKLVKLGVMSILPLEEMGLSELGCIRKQLTFASELTR